MNPLAQRLSIRQIPRRNALVAIGSACFALISSTNLTLAQTDVTIAVDLPDDRTRTGLLALKDRNGRVIAGPFRVLGKADGRTARAHNNSTRSRILPFGDTPGGGYRVTGAFKVGDGTDYAKKSYGIHGALRLDPVDGEAKQAKEIGGRTGLLIHSGDLGTQNRLRPTNGCLRLSNDDMKRLLDEIVVVAVIQGEVKAACAVSSVAVQVGDPAAPDEGYDGGDPPPTSAAPKIP
jgi:L,D-transpeptidase catalytic domain